MYLPEQPHFLEPNEPLHGFAVKIASWIAHRDRLGSDTAWIAGIYGARGSGKTTLLHTIYRNLARSGARVASRAEQAPCVLPRVELPSNSPDSLDLSSAIFAPAATRKQDDLLFMLLNHLEMYPRQDSSPQKRFLDARRAEVKRNDQAPFLKYAQEIATSTERFLEQLVEIHDQVARTTSTLRDAFSEALSTLRINDQILPILIDDLDLQPHRTLELLELLHLFMNVRGVVVLIAADKDLLLHSIDQALKLEDRQYPGLASALLAKYIPYEWRLPTPSEPERIDLLWPSESSELAKWWPDDALQGLRETRAAYHNKFQANRDREVDAHPPVDPVDLPLPEDAKSMFKQYLLPLAPVTYRPLKALHNRLVGWRESLEPNPGASDLDLRRAMHSRYRGLELDSYLLRPFLTMLAALDVRWPELELLVALEREPGAVRRALEELAAVDTREGQREEDARRGYQMLTGERPEDFPVLSTVLQESRFAGSDLGEAKRSLRKLARTWDEWRRRGANIVTEERFLAISVHVNVREESGEIWRSRFSAEEFDSWHLDLTRYVRGPKPSPEQIRQLRAPSLSFLRYQKQVASFQGRLLIFARAPLSFLIWTGWLLDRQRSVTVYNANAKVPFEGPVERLMFEDRGQYETMRESLHVPPIEDHMGEAGSAIAIVDLTLDHRAQPEQLERFYRDGILVRCPIRCLLTRSSTSPITQRDLVPILRDILELIGKLRGDRGIRHLHLALASPDVVAFFLGRQLKAQGLQISLYEMYSDHYEWVFDLEETVAAPPPAEDEPPVHQVGGVRSEGAS